MNASTARPKSLLTAAVQSSLTSRQLRNWNDKSFIDQSTSFIPLRFNEHIDDSTVDFFMQKMQAYIVELRTKSKNKSVVLLHRQFPGGETTDFNAYNALLNNEHLNTKNKILILRMLIPVLDINYGTHSPLITWVKWCMKRKSATPDDMTLLRILMQNITDRRKKDSHSKEALDYVIDEMNTATSIPDYLMTIYNELVGIDGNSSIYFNSNAANRKQYLDAKLTNDAFRHLKNGGRRVRLTYLPKKRGGRLSHVATFVQSCNARIQADAEWIMDDTLQAYDEAIETLFSFVGLTNIDKKPFVVKLMARGAMAEKEVRVQEWFREHPYRHIVQGICTFTCQDSALRWTSRLRAPQVFCKIEDKKKTPPQPMRVIIQEFISGGDLTKPRIWTIALWKSLFFQLTYACFEMYDMGFIYGDWNFGNILIDSTDEIEVKYNVFGKKIRVATEGICPVITDFARSLFISKEKLSIDHLMETIGMLWSILYLNCPDKGWSDWLNEKSITLYKCTSKAASLRIVHDIQTKFISSK